MKVYEHLLHYVEIPNEGQDAETFLKTINGYGQQGFRLLTAPGKVEQFANDQGDIRWVRECWFVREGSR